MFPKLPLNHGIVVPLTDDVITHLEKNWPERFSLRDRVWNALENQNVETFGDLAKEMKTISLTICEFCHIAGFLPLSLLFEIQFTLEELIYCYRHLFSLFHQKVIIQLICNKFNSDEYSGYLLDSLVYFENQDNSLTVLVQILSDLATVGRQYVEEKKLGRDLAKMCKKLEKVQVVKSTGLKLLVRECRKMFGKLGGRNKLPSIMSVMKKKIRELHENQENEKYFEEEYGREGMGDDEYVGEGIEFDPNEDYCYEDLYATCVRQDLKVDRKMTREELRKKLTLGEEKKVRKVKRE